MVTQYNPNNPKIIEIIRKHWNIIQFSDDCYTQFTHNPMMSLRKQPNLNNILCRAVVKFPPTPRLTNGQYRPTKNQLKTTHNNLIR
jgi:hypothetical protein